MLTKADQMVEKQPENQAVVYEAMAESLGATWKELNSQLQLRGNLLEDAVNFFNYVKKNQHQLEKLESFLRALQSFGDANAVKDATDKHKEIKNDVLDTAVGAMTYGEKSIEKIREIGSKSDDLERVKEVYNACTKIEKVMINLDEKRKELDQVWHEKKQTLDFKKQAAQIYKDLQTIEEW
uniref:DUF7799 domain-containing protein n=1 Tax=Romanomermis culicivorax TaxID=13658 RepID=A0A915HUD8_ROMCU